MWTRHLQVSLRVWSDRSVRVLIHITQLLSKACCLCSVKHCELHLSLRKLYINKAEFWMQSLFLPPLSLYNTCLFNLNKLTMQIFHQKAFPAVTRQIKVCMCMWNRLFLNEASFQKSISTPWRGSFYLSRLQSQLCHGPGPGNKRHLPDSEALNHKMTMKQPPGDNRFSAESESLHRLASRSSWAFILIKTSSVRHRQRGGNWLCKQQEVILSHYEDIKTI